MLRRRRHREHSTGDAFIPWLEAVSAVAACTLLGLLLQSHLPPGNLSLLMLAGVIIVALRHGWWPAALTSLLAALSLNFFFMVPYLGFDFLREENLIALLFFLAIAAALNNLSAQLHVNLERARAANRRTAQLYGFSRRLTHVLTVEELAGAVHEDIGAALGRGVVLLLAQDDGRLLPPVGPPTALSEAEVEVATWALHARGDARQETYAAPDGRWLLVPIHTEADAAAGPRALLAIDVAGHPLQPEERRLLFALRDQAAVALGRVLLMLERERIQLLTETEKLRAALLSSVSHDLRTPLVSILGATTTVLEFEARLAPADRRALLETVVEEAERLNRFVQNLLDMTRLGYRAVEVRRQTCDLRDLLADVRHRLRRRLVGRPLHVEAAPGFALAVDPMLFEQVLLNLLDNACKYAPAGTPITVSAHAEAGTAVVRVSDAGPGIAPQDRARVFDMFHRVRAGDSREAGTGLGLAICRGLVQAMGGSIEVVDATAGACLEVRLPDAARDAAATEEGP